LGLTSREKFFLTSRTVLVWYQPFGQTSVGMRNLICHIVWKGKNPSVDAIAEHFYQILSSGSGERTYTY